MLTFSECPLFGQKGRCWERFDAESGEARRHAADVSGE